jgi:hypothetical protein
MTFSRNISAGDQRHRLFAIDWFADNPLGIGR